MHSVGLAQVRRPIATLAAHGGAAQNRERASAALLAAARSEFLRHGFEGTDVARIARRSGVSPNTFYRFFKDKTAAFVAVYSAWAAEDRIAFERLIGRSCSITDRVSGLIGLYRQHPRFRRSIRRLIYEERLVAQAVARARLASVHALQVLLGGARPDPASLAADLIELEYLAHAIAEGEVTAMDLDDLVLRNRAAAILAGWRARPAREPTARTATLSQTAA